MDFFAADFEPIPLPDAELAMLRNALGRTPGRCRRHSFGRRPGVSETIRMWVMWPYLRTNPPLPHTFWHSLVTALVSAPGKGYIYELIGS